MFICLIVKNFYGYPVCNLVEFEDSEQGHPRSGSLGELLPPVLSSSAPELQGDWTEVRRRLKEKKEKKRKVRCFCETQGHSFGKKCRIYGYLCLPTLGLGDILFFPGRLSVCPSVCLSQIVSALFMKLHTNINQH